MGIKFRVLCEKHSRMEYYTLGDLVCGATLSNNGEGLFRGETWSLYTDADDINGKEIYVGDVVKHKATNKNWNPLDDDSPIEVEVLSVVEFKSHGFWLSNEYFGWEGEGLANWEQLEVVGNIYESPELLTQTTNQ